MRVCLLGFGEVGQALAADLRARVARLSAWDLKFSDAASASESRRRATECSRRADRAANAVADADLVISAVTAAQIGEAARAPWRRTWQREAYFFDLNSTSPAAKSAGGAPSSMRRAAGSSRPPSCRRSRRARAASPMLLGGAHAAASCRWRDELGFTGARSVLREVRRRVRGQDVPQRGRSRDSKR